MRKSPLLVIFITVLLDLVGFGIIIPLLPLYAKHLGANGTMVGVLMSSYSLMQLFFAPIWGRLSDKIGRRPLLLMSILGNCVALVVFGLGESYWWLLAARLIAGVCTANIAVAHAYIADVTTPENRAKGMGLVGAAFGLGFVLGPFLGGELSNLGGELGKIGTDGDTLSLTLAAVGLSKGALKYAAPPLFAALLALVNFALAFFMLPETLSVDDRAQSRGSVWQERLGLLRSVEGLGGILSLVFLQIFAFSMLEVVFVLFAEARLGFSVRQCGHVFAFIGVVMVVVQGGLIGRMARRYGEARLVIGGLAAVAAGMLLLPLTPPNGVTVLYLYMGLIAFGQALVTPSLSALLSKRAPGSRQGVALGLSQSASALARVAGPMVAGRMFDWRPPATPFIAGGALMALGLLLAVKLLRAVQTSASVSSAPMGARASKAG